MARSTSSAESGLRTSQIGIRQEITAFIDTNSDRIERLIASSDRHEISRSRLSRNQPRARHGARAEARLGQEAAMVWHAETALPKGTDLVVVPGGFSYGDYLRCGAIAARAPVMDAVRKFAADGGLVLGVCNGFQILCEAGPVARRPDAQRAAEIHLQGCASAGRAFGYAVHARLQCRPGHPRAGRAWRGQLRGRRRDREAAGRRGAGALSLLLGRGRRRRGVQHQRRRAIRSPASSTSAATCSA